MRQLLPVFFPIRSPDPIEGAARAAARRFVRYTVLAGMVFAVLQFGEVIAAKSLKAGALWVTVITMAAPVANLTSIWWARLLVGRDQRPLLRAASLAGGVILLSGLGLSTVQHLAGMYFAYFFLVALFTPAENRVLQQHVASVDTGRLYGLAAALRLGSAAVVSALAGAYLARVPGGYRDLYGAAAVIGLIGFWQIARVPTGRSRSEGPEPIDLNLIVMPLKKAAALLRRRKDFLRFEVAFMIYGIAFMMSLPVIPLYLVEDLGFDYDTIGLARGTTWQLSMAFGVFLCGRVFDRSTPHRMGALAFFLLSFFPWFLLAAGRLEGSWRLAAAYAGFAAFGFAMSAVMLIWSLSSIRFAGGEDAGVYHSVHLAATGIRGAFAPFCGYLVMSRLGKPSALVAVSVLWLIASLAMVLVRRWDIRVGDYHSLRATPHIR